MQPFKLFLVAFAIEDFSMNQKSLAFLVNSFMLLDNFSENREYLSEGIDHNLLSPIIIEEGNTSGKLRYDHLTLSLDFHLLKRITLRDTSNDGQENVLDSALYLIAKFILCCILTVEWLALYD